VQQVPRHWAEVRRPDAVAEVVVAPGRRGDGDHAGRSVVPGRVEPVRDDPGVQIDRGVHPLGVERPDRGRQVPLDREAPLCR
jgi:hypothetical protein